MRYLLDTNICIYAMKRSPKNVFDRLRRCAIGDVGVSAITYSELEFGASNSRDPQGNRNLLNQFVAPLDVIAYEPQVAPVYGQIRTDLTRKGRPIGPLDMLIAAHALYLNCTLVTNNKKEFSRVPGLRIENWT
jgi:tRNA(fMet)-specific endonuclease VapC